MNIFDIMGPIMVGPSSSHTAGAARMGRVARHLLGSQPARAEILLHGSFAATGAGHGTDRAIVAGLLDMAPDHPDIPRSFQLAKEAGMEVTIRTVELPNAHPNTAVMNLDNGRHRLRGQLPALPVRDQYRHHAALPGPPGRTGGDGHGV